MGGAGEREPEAARGPGGSAPPAVPIVCLSYDPWGAYEKNIHRLMRRLSARPEISRVLFLEPELWISRLLAEASGDDEPGAADARLRALRAELSHPAEKLAVYAPVHRVVLSGRFPPLRRIDRSLVCRGVRRVLNRAGIADPILWVNRPVDPWLLDGIGPRRALVFHWTDDWEAFASAREREATRANTEALLRRAGLVLAVSPGLRDRAAAVNPRAALFPNATDPEAFEAADDPATPIAPPLVGLPRPILGFVGFVSPRIDFALLETVARRRPEWTFVFVGPERRMGGGADRFFRLANARRVGARPASEIPSYYRGMDCCLVPFLRDASTLDADAIKIYEYLAAGRPVVATNAAGADRAREWIRVAEGPEAFERAIDEALSARDPSIAAGGRAFARRNSWEARAEEAIRLLAERGWTAAPSAGTRRAPASEGTHRASATR